MVLILIDGFRFTTTVLLRICNHELAGKDRMVRCAKLSTLYAQLLLFCDPCLGIQ